MTAGSPEEFGPYVVFEEIGAGGMATVHRAESRGLEGFRRPIALKRMLPHCASSTDFVQAFVREARIASHLRHANVAQTYELGKVNGVYFIAMELVQGKNLRQILKHCAQMTGPMPVAVTLNVLNQICDALDYAHNLADDSGQPLGIIHRDVSPSNIIVSEAGVVKLIDFGIAKASAAGMQTMSGLLKGKFGYMAPEYIAGSIDARADLFALGVIAHELLTNRPLFTGRDDMETLNRVRGMVIKPPSARNAKVPPEIDEIVMTALERDPERRWQHATALRNALTTMTKRLRMVVSGAEVAEWIEWAFGQDRPTQIEIDDGLSVNTTGVREHPTVADSPEIIIDDQRKTIVHNGSGAHSYLRPSVESLTPPVRPSDPYLSPRRDAIAPIRGSDPNMMVRQQTPSRASDPYIRPPPMQSVPPVSQPMQPQSHQPSGAHNVAHGSQPPIQAPAVVMVARTANPAVDRVPVFAAPPPATSSYSGQQVRTMHVSGAVPASNTPPTSFAASGAGQSHEITRVVRTPNPSLAALSSSAQLEQNAVPASSNLGIVAAAVLGLAALTAVVLYFVLTR